MKNKLKALRSESGFSLVELIVTIAIMVILIAILIPNISAYIKKASEANVQVAAKEIYNAASVYVSEELAKGHDFDPNDTITPSVLWSGDDSLIDEPTGYDDIEVKISSTGANINYVYLRKGDFEVDYPKGNSGKIAYSS